MTLVVLGVGVVALIIVGAVMVNGAAHADAQGEFPVVGWVYEEVLNADGSITVVTPELDRLQAQRWANDDETDPQLERWALAELEAMREALEHAPAEQRRQA